MLPLSPPDCPWSQDYHLHLNTEDRDPVPSKVLIHYLKEDAPVPMEVLPPVIMKDLGTISSTHGTSGVPQCQIVRPTSLATRGGWGGRLLVPG